MPRVSGGSTGAGWAINDFGNYFVGMTDLIRSRGARTAGEEVARMSKFKKGALIGGGVMLAAAALRGRSTHRSSGANGLTPRSSGGASGLYG